MRTGMQSFVATKAALAEQQLVISVDTKKKELVGEFKNAGRGPRHSHEPGGALRGLAADVGCVSVGIDHDTAAFAVQTIRRWWQEVRRVRYPEAKRLVITADGGGSNGFRLRLWKRELQRFANELGIEIAVSHFPPRTSKWNNIEHRLFSFISQNGRRTARR